MCEYGPFDLLMFPLDHSRVTTDAILHTLIQAKKTELENALNMIC